jgi:hypothetical protein
MNNVGKEGTITVQDGKGVGFEVDLVEEWMFLQGMVHSHGNRASTRTIFSYPLRCLKVT